MENKHEHNCFFCNWKSLQGSQKKLIIIRWILGIFILITVFYFGVKIGEISYFVKSGFIGDYDYSKGMMGGYGRGYSNNGYWGSGMMEGCNN